MAIQGFCPPPSPPSHSTYYQLLERGSARLGRVKNEVALDFVNHFVGNLVHISSCLVSKIDFEIQCDKKS